MPITIQLRRATASQWTSQNPVLALGEPALEEDTGRQKIGDGVTNWGNLPYYSAPGITITTQSGTAYTVAISDANTQIDFTNDAAVTISIPDHASVPFPKGAIINFVQWGMGTLIIVASNIATIFSPAGSTTRGQWSTISVVNDDGEDTWLLSGDLSQP